MNEDPLRRLGPAPFHFRPSQPGRRGAAYTASFRLLASVLVLACAVWLALLWRQGALTGAGLSWVLGGMALMLLTWWQLLTSHTRIDEDAIEQDWLWRKRLDLRELAYCKLIRVRGLDWLIAPRLYARTLLGKFAVFYVADPALIADCERLARELADFRRL